VEESAVSFEFSDKSTVCNCTPHGRDRVDDWVVFLPYWDGPVRNSARSLGMTLRIPRWLRFQPPKLLGDLNFRDR